MHRVYLDQGHWVALSRAAFGLTAEHSEVLALAHSAVDLGLVSFPLSSIHYGETYNRRDPGSRWRLARVMGDLSKFHAIAPANVVLPSEVDQALFRRFGRPREPRACQVFGVGVAHAFGDPRLEPDSSWLRRQGSEASRLWQLFSLAGPMPEIPGSELIDMENYKKPSLEFRDVQVNLSRTFKTEGFHQERRKDALAAQERWGLVETELRTAMPRADIPEGKLLTTDKEALTEFVEDIPTRNVAFQLRRLRHDNPEDGWTRTDLLDLGFLAVAVPYCDVVVTEKRWVHNVNRAGLGEKYDTMMLKSLPELREFLVDETPPA